MSLFIKENEFYITYILIYDDQNLINGVTTYGNLFRREPIWVLLKVCILIFADGYFNTA